MPMIIGAGVGALSSAAMGKSPFTGALLGGATGGAFGGAGGFGSGFTQGGLAPSLGFGSAGSALGGTAPTMMSSEFISPYTVSGVAGQQMMNSALTAPMTQGMYGTLSNYFQNPLNIGSAVTKAEGILSPNQPQQMMQPSIVPIKQGAYQATPTPSASNAEPNYGLGQQDIALEKTGRTNLKSLLAGKKVRPQFYPNLFEA